MDLSGRLFADPDHSTYDLIHARICLRPHLQRCAPRPWVLWWDWWSMGQGNHRGLWQHGEFQARGQPDPGSDSQDDCLGSQAEGHWWLRQFPYWCQQECRFMWTYLGPGRLWNRQGLGKHGAISARCQYYPGSCSQDDRQGFEAQSRTSCRKVHRPAWWQGGGGCHQDPGQSWHRQRLWIKWSLQAGCTGYQRAVFQDAVPGPAPGWPILCQTLALRAQESSGQARVWSDDQFLALSPEQWRETEQYAHG